MAKICLGTSKLLMHDDRCDVTGLEISSIPTLFHPLAEQFPRKVCPSRIERIRNICMYFTPYFVEIMCFGGVQNVLFNLLLLICPPGGGQGGGRRRARSLVPFVRCCRSGHFRGESSAAELSCGNVKSTLRKGFCP